MFYNIKIIVLKKVYFLTQAQLLCQLTKEPDTKQKF